MLDPRSLYDLLATRGITHYSGVPDSLLKHFCACVTDCARDEDHVGAVHEGSAVALTAGYHLATGRIGCVYLQNSGLGNAVNPLASLTDPEVYGIPMLLVIGWRGEPGRDDEPQHVRMGVAQREILDALGIEHEVLPDDLGAAAGAIDRAVAFMREKRAPYALLVRAGTFGKYVPRAARVLPYRMTREEALGVIADALATLAPEAVYVGTTGMLSRELYEHRARTGQAHDRDFLCVGSMGHASQIALGIAMAKPDTTVVCLDGDGAMLMHLGGLATTGTRAPRNYKHVVFNNGAHDSVGGQPTAGLDVDLRDVAMACGYYSTHCALGRPELGVLLPTFVAVRGPALLEVCIRTGARSDLGRPTETPREAKEAFMRATGAR